VGWMHPRKRIPQPSVRPCSAALMHVIGTKMDYVQDRVRSEFIFENPNAKGECGCGESFNV